MTQTEAATVEITFSRDRTLYYVNALDYHRPHSWVGVEPDADGKFKVLPFTFYEVRGGEREKRSESDPLVERYIAAEGWPARGSKEWTAEAFRVREHAAERIANAEQDREAAMAEFTYLSEMLIAHGAKP